MGFYKGNSHLKFLSVVTELYSEKKPFFSPKIELENQLGVGLYARLTYNWNNIVHLLKDPFTWSV